jgi:hypothetical protein
MHIVTSRIISARKVEKARISAGAHSEAHRELHSCCAALQKLSCAEHTSTAELQHYSCCGCGGRVGCVSWTHDTVLPHPNIFVHNNLMRAAKVAGCVMFTSRCPMA